MRESVDSENRNILDCAELSPGPKVFLGRSPVRAESLLRNTLVDDLEECPDHSP